MGFSFLTQELAIDLGTANTVIFQNDQIVLDEPSIVALDNNSGKLIALGHQAKLIQDRENPGIKTVRPLRDGVIADFNAAELMIRGFIKQVNSDIFPCRKSQMESRIANTEVTRKTTCSSTL